jgi:hypothetical protein
MEWGNDILGRIDDLIASSLEEKWAQKLNLRPISG